MGKSGEMGLKVCDVLGSVSCVLQAVKPAKDIGAPFYKTCCDSSVEGEWVRPDTRSVTTLIHEEMSAGRIEEIGSQRSLAQSQQFCHFW